MYSFLDNWTKRPAFKGEPLPSVIKTVTAQDVLVNGIHQKKLVDSSVVVEEMFSGLHPDDFALANIIAAGAVDSLREVRLSSNNVDSDIDSINRMMNDVDAIDSNLKSN